MVQDTRSQQEAGEKCGLVGGSIGAPTRQCLIGRVQNGSLCSHPEEPGPRPGANGKSPTKSLTATEALVMFGTCESRPRPASHAGMVSAVPEAAELLPSAAELTLSSARALGVSSVA